MLFQGQVGRGFQVVRAGVEREPKRADLATNGALRRGLGSPDRDLGLAAVQVQGAVTGANIDLNVGVLPDERGNQRRRMIAGKGLGAREPHPTAQLGVLPKDFETERMYLRLDPLGIVNRRPTGVGRHIAVVETVEEPHAGFLLNRLYVAEDRAVGLAERACRTRKAAGPSDGQDDVEVVPLIIAARCRLFDHSGCLFLQDDNAIMWNA